LKAKDNVDWEWNVRDGEQKSKGNNPGEYSEFLTSGGLQIPNCFSKIIRYRKNNSTINYINHKNNSHLIFLHQLFP